MEDRVERLFEHLTDFGHSNVTSTLRLHFHFLKDVRYVKMTVVQAGKGWLLTD